MASRRSGSQQNTIRQLSMVLAVFPLSVTERLCRTSSTLCSGAMASAALITACWVAGDKL